MQENEDKKRHLCRYKSSYWNPAEQIYNAIKRECRGVLKALRKLQNWLYAVYFVLETDVNILVAQLNSAALNLLGFLLMRQIAYIKLFNFTVKYILGKKHTAADALSCQPRTSRDIKEEALEENVEDYINTQLLTLRIALVRIQLDQGSKIQAKQDDIFGVLENNYFVRY